MTERRFGRYVVKDELPRGGSARTFRAYDPASSQDVALKLLPRELAQSQIYSLLFRNEIPSIRALEHAALTPVYDFGQEHGLYYVASQFMPGGNLADRLRGGPLTLDAAAGILRRLADGLDFAHQHGVLHLNLKPANILFDNDGKAYLSDFGLASLAQLSVDSPAPGQAGAAYASPEQRQFADNQSSRSDVYALGALLFEMLTGRQWAGAGGSMPDLSILNASLPPQCQAVLEKALADDPEKRYATPGQFAEAVERLGQAPAPQKTGATKSDKAAPSKAPALNRLSPAVMGGIGFAIVVCIVGSLAVGYVAGSYSQIRAVQQAALLTPTLTPTATQTPSPTPFDLPAISGAHQMLGYNVVDAAYSLSLDRIILISTNPNQIHIYDPRERIDRPIALSRAPRSLALSPDGKFAAVGHDALISYVDLEAAAVAKKFDAPLVVEDLALLQNGWIVVLKTDVPGSFAQRTVSWLLEVATGKIATLPIEQLTNLPAHSRAYPAGDYAYFVGQSGGELSRVDLSRPTAPKVDTKLLKSLCSDFWFSQDGQMLVDACGQVYGMPSDAEDAPILKGALESMDKSCRFTALTHSPEAGLILAITKEFCGNTYGPAEKPDDLIIAYDDKTFDLLRATTLPAPVPGLRMPAAPLYVFFSSTGDEYYVVARFTESPYEQTKAFGVVTGDPDASEVVEAPEPTPQPTAVASVQLLDYRVFWGAYDAPRDRLLLFSGDGYTPMALHIVNLNDFSDTLIGFPGSPTLYNDVALHPDGKTLAISYKGAITLIDLESQTIQNEIQVDYEPGALWFAGDSLYLLSSQNYSTSLRRLDLETGQDSILDGDVSLYDFIGQQGSPVFYATSAYDDLYQVDLSKTPPEILSINVKLRDRCGNPRLSDDGQWMYTSCGMIYRASKISEETPWEYAGTLTFGTLYSASFDARYFTAQSSSPEGMLVIADPGSCQRDFFGIVDMDSLEVTRTILLPEVKVDDGTAKVSPKNLFYNSRRDTYYLVADVCASSRSGATTAILVGRLGP